MQPVGGNWSCSPSRTLLTAFDQEMLSVLGGHLLAISKLTNLPTHIISLLLAFYHYSTSGHGTNFSYLKLWLVELISF